MPVWHEASRQWVKDGKVVLLGITQEQHPERCRLFAQWQGFEWPILHDPINVLKSTAVPIVVAIDEHGVVRSTRPNPRTFEAEFLDKEFPAPESLATKSNRPDLDELKANAKTAEGWRNYADALAIWEPGRATDAIAAYQEALKLNPDSGDILFRLGVCYRMRYESDSRQPDDFALAVEHWTRALEVDPNQYIWRRRIQQYGPRLDKPYPFYDWVEQAQTEIRKRGEEPVELAVPPSGAEIAQPSRSFAEDGGEAENPDPNARINRDRGDLVKAETAVVPSAIRAGEAVRLHVTLRPSADKKAHWTNEAGPTQVWFDVPEGWKIEQRLLTGKVPKDAETAEPRHFEIEVRSPDDAEGPVKLNGYALYYVCEGVGGTCLYLRRDVEIDVAVKPRE